MNGQLMLVTFGIDVTMISASVVAYSVLASSINVRTSSALSTAVCTTASMIVNPANVRRAKCESAMPIPLVSLR
jgi:hypothetical protein